VSRIRADLLLVERGLFESRAKARAAIEAGGVSADGAPVTRASQMLDVDCAIEAEPAHRWVGRGALKLDHALSIWPVAVEGRVVLDLGASTGGFTEVCLARGAARVYAVDVGHGQLHASLAADPRVVDLPGTDARALTRELIADTPALIVCDASFISLTKLLPVPLTLAEAGCDLIALVKPQFELAPADIGKGGLVREPEKRAAAVAAVIEVLEGWGWAAQASAESPVRGGEGAVEYLLWAKQKSRSGR
jgi:23S rRNA (cytidine1920-2'-O)/16S rRNA (cytidine1409-2'-O)-methyltransferase